MRECIFLDHNPKIISIPFPFPRVSLSFRPFEIQILFVRSLLRYTSKTLFGNIKIIKPSLLNSHTLVINGRILKHLLYQHNNRLSTRSHSGFQSHPCQLIHFSLVAIARSPSTRFIFRSKSQLLLIYFFYSILKGKTLLFYLFVYEENWHS